MISLLFVAVNSALLGRTLFYSYKLFLYGIHNTFIKIKVINLKMKTSNNKCSEARIMNDGIYLLLLLLMFYSTSVLKANGKYCKG